MRHRTVSCVTAQFYALPHSFYLLIAVYGNLKQSAVI
jgi:hypothetical protein